MRRVFFQRNKGRKLILPIKPKNLIVPRSHQENKKPKDIPLKKDNK